MPGRAEAGTRTATSTLGALSLRAASALAVGSGVAIWLAFPATGLWPLAPVGVGMLALATRGQRPRIGAWLGLLCGWAMFGPLLAWSGVYVGKLPWFALATLEALYIALLGAVAPALWRLERTRWPAAWIVLGTAGLWVAQEALRSRTPFGGFPWGRLAFSQSESPLLGLAALGGAPLVSAGVAAAAALFALAVVQLVHLLRMPTGVGDVARDPTLAAARRSPTGRRGERRAVIGALAAGAAASAVLAAPSAVPRPVAGVRQAQIAAVQGNVPQPGLDFNAERRAVLDNHARATRDLAERVQRGAAAAPEVVIWPENASDIDPLRNADAANVIQAATDAVGAPVVVGSVLLDPSDRLANASIVWGPTSSAVPGPGQAPGGRYIKRHPAPFGEYIPYRSFFRRLSAKVDLVRRDFLVGSGAPILDVTGADGQRLRLGDVICFEVGYDDLVRDAVRGGAQVLLVQTNNATFGYTDESIQQLAMSRLRAVESGRAVVHISTVGVSALIAPDGSLLDRSGHFTARILRAALPLRTDLTWATRVGAWPEAALVALGGVTVLFGTVRRRRLAGPTREE